MHEEQLGSQDLVTLEDGNVVELLHGVGDWQLVEYTRYYDIKNMYGEATGEKVRRAVYENKKGDRRIRTFPLVE